MTNGDVGFRGCRSIMMFVGMRSLLLLGALFLVILAMSGCSSGHASAFARNKKDGFRRGFDKGGGFGASANETKDPVEFYFPGYDTNGDGELDRSEWRRRGNFERLDADGSGTLNRSEFRAMYDKSEGEWRLSNPIRPSDTAEMEQDVGQDRIGAEVVGERTICGMTRRGVPGLYKCQRGDEIATQLGLFETGMGPVFPRGAICRGIDEIFAMDYTKMTGIGMHGGIDIPTDFGTPILAVAAGTVVGKFDPERNARGRTIVLRHRPEDTGSPFWVFTEYAHMDAMPRQDIGQRVRMGEILGPTGNSGMSKRNVRGTSMRRPAIHFAVYYSDSPRFTEIEGYIVPENGRWMDPNALYRRTPPYDSPSVKALPEIEKEIPVPVMYLDGSTEPANTRLIWPYACRRE